MVNWQAKELKRIAWSKLLFYIDLREYKLETIFSYNPPFLNGSCFRVKILAFINILLALLK